MSEDIGHIDTVHHRCQHPDLICLSPVNRLARTASPEISAACHDRHLDSVVHQFLHLIGNADTGRLIKACLFISREGFPAQLK